MSLTHCVADALSCRSPSPQGSNAGAGLRDVTNSSSARPAASRRRAMLAAFAGSVQSSSTTSRSPRRLATRPSTLERKRASVARLLALRLLNRQVAAIALVALESGIYATGTKRTDFERQYTSLLYETLFRCRACTAVAEATAR